MNIADILRKVSGLLFWQGRYIWSLSCALNALNEYMKIASDTMRDSKIRDSWISIVAMINIILNKQIKHLLETEFPISNEERELMNNKMEKTDENNKEIQSKENQLATDKKDMLIRFYIEIFELAYKKDNLIDIVGVMGDEFKKQVNDCLYIGLRKIINRTAKECKIKSEEIKAEIKKNATPFKKSETQMTAREMLEDLMKNLEAAQNNDNRDSLWYTLTWNWS
jgi:hypothetical protein